MGLRIRCLTGLGLLDFEEFLVGRTLAALLKAGLEEAQVALRTATGERVGWLQGEAQCLAEWVKQFEGAGR